MQWSRTIQYVHRYSQPLGENRLLRPIQCAGRHEEHVGRGDGEFLQRFPKGRTFVVRVKPGRHEISVMRDDDQTDGVRPRLERADEEMKRR
jgi:hypothetical protein